MEGFYNLRSPAVKRLMREAEELKSATGEYYAQPLEDNLFEWHFTVQGPPKTEFDGGIYHGRILLPPDYPMKPPSIVLLTPNGRFEVNKKICLSISGHHPESWQPSWSIRTALLAIIGFMPTHGNGAIGSLDYSPDERKTLALRSRCWKCVECGPIEALLQSTVITAIPDKEKVPEIEQVKEGVRNISVNGLIPAMHSDLASDAVTEHVYETMQSSQPYHQVQCPTLSNPRTYTNVPKQRLLTSQRDCSNTTNPVLAEALVQVGTTAHNMRSGAFTTVCMWTIVFLIMVLLIRRLLFL